MLQHRFNALLQKIALAAFIAGFASVFLLRQTQSTKAQDMAESATAGKPNIVLILTDDLDRDSIRFMPKLKQFLMDEGVSFDNYFVNVSLCCPSRVTTLRGQYAHNHKIKSNNLPNGGFTKVYKTHLEKSTVAAWLKKTGYSTVFIGKYLNQYPDGAQETYIPPGWTWWYGSTGGGKKGYNHSINENGKIVYYQTSPEDYATDVYKRKAIAFIANSGTKPFFLFIAPNAPHDPAAPAKRHERLFNDIHVPQTPSFNETDVSDKPQWIRDLPLLTAVQISQMDALYRNRLRSLQAVDDLIGNLMSTLKTKGKLDNTYIFFTSDNGFHMGQHRLSEGKHTAYEEDIILPLIVRGPTIAKGATVKEITGNIDLAPTFAQLAGAETPAFVDGRSLAPFLGADKKGLPSQWRQSFLIEGYENTPDTADESPVDSSIAKPAFSAIRGVNFTYVEYATGEKEYYDLTSDPYQLQNSVNMLNSDTAEKLSAKTNTLKTCASDVCRKEETSLP